MNKAVIGLGFGDEGKGEVVNYLCASEPDAMVVRFNGGHQAGHSVYGGEQLTNKHVFSNFGSGSFKGNYTYWDKFCTVEPIGLMRELWVLDRKKVYPTLYVNYDCPVTTPYDIAYNRTMERLNKHGSCGVGFGSTIGREEAGYQLHYIDLFYDIILQPKMDGIRKYYGFDVDLDCFYEAIEKLRGTDSINPVTNPPRMHDLIYEGAQGLLLDQTYGYFPNVTRSYCGTQNIDHPCNVEYYLVTRCYQTRHGNGFMSNENADHIWLDPWETNYTHPWQGEFRRGTLDMNLINYAMNSDPVLRQDDVPKYMVITCLDHAKSHRLMVGDNLCELNTENDLVAAIEHNLEVPVWGFALGRKTKDGISFTLTKEVK